MTPYLPLPDDLCERCDPDGARPAIKISQGPYGPYLDCGQHPASADS